MTQTTNVFILHLGPWNLAWFNTSCQFHSKEIPELLAITVYRNHIKRNSNDLTYTSYLTLLFFLALLSACINTLPCSTACMTLFPCLLPAWLYSFPLLPAWLYSLALLPAWIYVLLTLLPAWLYSLVYFLSTPWLYCLQGDTPLLYCLQGSTPLL